MITPHLICWTPRDLVVTPKTPPIFSVEPTSLQIPLWILYSSFIGLPSNPTLTPTFVCYKKVKLHRRSHSHFSGNFHPVRHFRLFRDLKLSPLTSRSETERRTLHTHSGTLSVKSMFQRTTLHKRLNESLMRREWTLGVSIVSVGSKDYLVYRIVRPQNVGLNFIFWWQVV